MRGAGFVLDWFYGLTMYYPSGRIHMKKSLLLAAAAAMALLVMDAGRAQQPINAPPPGAKGGDPAFAKGKAGGGGKGKAAVPAGPTPRTADGKVILSGETPGKNGVWLPGGDITLPAANPADIQ